MNRTLDTTRGFFYRPWAEKPPILLDHDGPMRVGKTRRDRVSGAWMNRLANRARKAEENKRAAGVTK